MSEAVEWDVAATKRGARLGLTRDGRNHASYLQLASFFLAFPSNHQPPLIILCSCLRFKCTQHALAGTRSSQAGGDPLWVALKSSLEALKPCGARKCQPQMMSFINNQSSVCLLVTFSLQASNRHGGASGTYQVPESSRSRRSG